MNVEHKLQQLKAGYKLEKQQRELRARERLNVYRSRVVQKVLQSIKAGKLHDGDHVRFTIRMDEKHQFDDELLDVNAMLNEHNIKIDRIHVQSMCYQNCVMNPFCCCCCPCIFIPTAITNWLFGTEYEVVVYVNVLEQPTAPPA